MLPNRRKELFQWVTGVTVTVIIILGIAFWLDNENETEQERASAATQPRVPASTVMHADQNPNVSPALVQ